jgi:D-serine dehydratase
MAAPAHVLDLLDPWLDAAVKGFPPACAPLRRSQVAAQRWNALAGDLPLPLALLKRDALDHNLRWMQSFADGAGVGLAPHAKTTLAPALLARQLSAGAWGLTVASVGQLKVAVESGARRVIVANQLVQRVDLAAVLDAQQQGLKVVFLLDSLQQLRLIEGFGFDRPFDVLLEIGRPGGRAGQRSNDAALALARHARASAAVRLVGVECFEGLGLTGDDASDVPATEALLQRLSELASACDAERLFEADEVIVSAGGSAVFDLVAPRLRLTLSQPVRPLLRSGCYVTHDHGLYRRLVSAAERRLGCGNGLQGALEVWANVLSVPEPGLAILGVGRRDVSYDIEMPLPIRFAPRIAEQPVRAPPDWTVASLNDQHAYLRCAGSEPDVGDRVGLGVSHPCTTFDKWRWMPVVDERYVVVDAITTAF